MNDYLLPLPVDQVAAWYRRLADQVARQLVNGQPPLAAQLLRHYLSNRDPNSTYRFTAPPHLRNSPHILARLQQHRRVFLTEEQATFTGGRRAWAGVIPRLQRHAGFTPWDLSNPLDMSYENLVEIGSDPIDILRIQRLGSAEEQDLFTSLRGFQLRSDVTVRGDRRLPQNDVLITFVSWSCRVKDRYDFNYNEYLTLPNPDYGSAHEGAVRPRDQQIRVYHRNARRLEEAQLAAPYNIESDIWSILDSALRAPASVNPQRRL